MARGARPKVRTCAEVQCGERGEHARADGVSDRNETAVENVCRMLLYLQLTRYCTVQYVEAPTEQG